MQPKYPHLFSPIRIGKHLFKNRILSAPLGAWVFSPDNYIFDYAISMFEEKARGGAAAVTVGHTEVNYGDEDSDGFGLYFDFRRREGSAALAEFASAIQQYGAHASAELNYGGIAQTVPEDSNAPSPGGPPVTGVSYGVSGGRGSGGAIVPEMTQNKMQSVIADYVKCVEKMCRCGFHMVTIHGAHGWMPAQFLSPVTNRRSDEYGGSLENRMRFPLELMRAVRAAAGADMVVEYRLSGVDPSKDPAGFEELVTFCGALEGLADIIHVSSGGLTEDSFTHTFPSYLSPRGVNRTLAASLKKRVNIPIAVVGAISRPEMAEEFIAGGVADFVALCRPLIADPAWPEKAKRGREDDIIPCIACYSCLDVMHKSHFLGCAVNPRSGREHRVPPIEPAAVKKNVVVVGGGPSGLQAAITAADRGHNVTLFEKSGALGGLLKISDENDIKWMLNGYKNYLIGQTLRRPIRVLLNTEATPGSVETYAPDTVIVASGSEPIVPKIPGVDGTNVFTCTEIHENRGSPGGRLVVVGGNLVGCETALYLKNLGKTEVTVLEMTGALHADLSDIVSMSLDGRMREAGIRAVTGARCVKISPDGVTARSEDGEEEFLPCDTVVLAVGLRPRRDVFESLLSSAADVIPVGDCVSPATVMQASRTAYFAARNL
ncbi:MAG: FAD-dependent oxidoreductase [Oscillospiraceae bacterium]|jgi:2,4-dienoyl-CoA reductase-like NADH-dependent reductase (Old Yellow Enzyme family)/thioredoxin reductase|nr:FAD-dependent oxidoreductase [Oscillospiraceae bacterium]